MLDHVITLGDLIFGAIGLGIYQAAKAVILDRRRVRRDSDNAYCQRPEHDCGAADAGPCNGLPRVTPSAEQVREAADKFIANGGEHRD